MTRNASTGPRSAEGKARSSRNALKSGIYAKSLVIPGEDPAHLDTLRDEYSQRFCPDLPEQRDLVDILVRSTWTLRRLAVAEAQVFAFQMDTVYKLSSEAPLGHAFSFGDRTLSRLQRMVNSTQRNFRDALRELERLQSIPIDFDPPAAPIIEPHPPPRPPAPVPQQPAETKPVNNLREFVSSTSTQPPRTAPKTAPKAPEEPLPFHRPGARCLGEHTDREKYKQCPWCYPPERMHKTQD
jgi:hypothetical protein